MGLRMSVFLYHTHITFWSQHMIDRRKSVYDLYKYSKLDFMGCKRGKGHYLFVLPHEYSCINFSLQRKTYVLLTCNYLGSSSMKTFLMQSVPSSPQEYWCKRLHPKNVAEKVFRQPPLRESPRRGRIRKEDLSFTKQKINILKAADLIGEKIQYDCPGFLPNRRQVILFFI